MPLTPNTRPSQFLHQYEDGPSDTQINATMHAACAIDLDTRIGELTRCEWAEILRAAMVV